MKPTLKENCLFLKEAVNRHVPPPMKAMRVPIYRIMWSDSVLATQKPL